MQRTADQWVAKISDFDRSKQLAEGRHSATMSGGGGGTEGWRSVEMIEIYNKKSQAKLVSCIKCRNLRFGPKVGLNWTNPRLFRSDVLKSDLKKSRICEPKYRPTYLI